MYKRFCDTYPCVRTIPEVISNPIAGTAYSGGVFYIAFGRGVLERGVNYRSLLAILAKVLSTDFSFDRSVFAISFRLLSFTTN
jgi:hypothetical protein